MRLHLAAFIAAAIAFLGLDFIWLSQMAPGLYRAMLGDLLAPTPNMAAAATFYVIYLTGVIHFCVLPAIARGRLASALFSGGLFGLVAYATYDLTNMATLRDWPVLLSVIDMSWGTFVTSVASAAGYWSGTRLSANRNNR